MIQHKHRSPSDAVENRIFENALLKCPLAPNVMIAICGRLSTGRLMA